MINESHIGQRVISEYWGTGIITEFDPGTDTYISEYPIGVNFNILGIQTNSEVYFEADGTCCINSNNSTYSIRLLEE